MAVTVQSLSKEWVDILIRNAMETASWELFEDGQQLCSRMYHLFASAVTNFLAKVKSTDGKVGLLIEDPGQNFCFLGLVEYHPNADKDMPGNWSFSFSFDAKDADDCVTVYRTSGNEFKEVACDIAEKSYGFFPKTKNGEDPAENMKLVISIVISNVARCIRQWVEENSVSKEVKVSEIPGWFIIEAALDDSGTKVFSISPSPEAKNIIKDDATIELKKEAEAA